MTDLREIAHGVLFPVVTDLTLPEAIWAFLDHGGRALLFGETGEEYATGRMSSQRLSAESAQRWREVTQAATARAGTLIVALDADVSAVHRLQAVAPALPTLAQAESMSDQDFETAVERVARVARELGVNVFLSPTADVVAGANPWLSGRTLGRDPGAVSRLVRAYVRGCQRGGVSATLKHFPGHPILTGVPAVDMDARVALSRHELEPYLEPFAAGIAAGARAVMMGPAIFDAYTPSVAASVSPDLYRLLRSRLRFGGLVMTCDLDHRATMRDAGLPQTAVRALQAGADLLLISPSGVPQIPEIVAAIVTAIQAEQLSLERLQAAWEAVRKLAGSSVALQVVN
jgi:beta-N-acetylhexosaminidase